MISRPTTEDNCFHAHPQPKKIKNAPKKSPLEVELETAIFFIIEFDYEKRSK
jgi:hypothetical protein